MAENFYPGRKIDRVNLHLLQIAHESEGSVGIAIRDKNPRLIFKKADYKYQEGETDFTKLIYVRMNFIMFNNLMDTIVKMAIEGGRDKKIEYINNVFDKDGKKTGTGVDSTLFIKNTEKGIVLKAVSKETAIEVPIFVDTKWFHLRFSNNELQEMKNINRSFAKTWANSCKDMVSHLLAEVFKKRMRLTEK